MAHARRYIVNAEGVGWACADRLPALLSSDSVVLKQASENAEFWYAMARPWRHYAPVDARWRDLRAVLACLRANDTLAQRIAERGQRLARSLSLDALLCYAWHALLAVHRLAPPQRWHELAAGLHKLTGAGRWEITPLVSSGPED